MANSVEERLRRLEDAEEIRLLLTDYVRLLDAYDLPAYAALFAREGEWTGPYVGSARGPQAILELMRTHLRPGSRGAHHIVSNMVVEVEGDRGSAWSRWTYVVPGADGAPSLAVSGRYDDRLVRENGRWRFAARIVAGDLNAPVQ